ncbi:hypothetical protein [Phaffia rhodozyma]|uniref:Uncharacterized protein n=1 Tax=Phaffia rhodozyma TaxID=264483 RepID=A0A0F7SLK5_PHARH|nr:hypothetical protein [Phaffia rhodozyma]
MSKCPGGRVLFQRRFLSTSCLTFRSSCRPAKRTVSTNTYSSSQIGSYNLFHSGLPSTFFFSQPSPQDPRPSSSNDNRPLSDAQWVSQFSLAISHLHTTLPSFFAEPPVFPPTLFHPSVHLTTPPLFNFHLSSLRMYSLFFTGARTSLSILLKDPGVKIERVLVIPCSEEGTDGSKNGGEVRVEGQDGEWAMISRSRLDRKVRIRVKVKGRLRVPLDVVEHGILGGGDGPDREWTISNLYSFSPLTALITHHQVESIYPAPTEGVGAWLGAWNRWALPGGGTPAPETTGGEGKHGGCAGASGMNVDKRGKLE